jgi:hypothetical protein
MKLYKKIELSLDQVGGFFPYEDENYLQIEEQDILIEIELKTNQDNELVESPFAIVKNFHLLISESRTKRHDATRFHPSETDIIPFEDHIYNEEQGYEVILNTDFLDSFDSILADFDGIIIDDTNLKIYIG